MSDTKPEENLSDRLDLASKYIDVRGSKMHYVEQGEGDPVLFLHGIPANLYLWRNVIPEVSSFHRAIALDLIGYGKSDVPSIGGYDANNQYMYLEGFIEKMELKNITIVGIDLGSVLGLKYVADHPENIHGIVITEGIIMPALEWYDQLGIMQKMMFAIFRNKAIAKLMIPLMQPILVPMMTQRTLSKAEKLAYYEPYANDKEKNEVVFQGPGPVGFPTRENLKPGKATRENIIMMNENAQKLKGTDIPMLILYTKPGAILNEGAREYAKKNYLNLTLEYLGVGKHFSPEEHSRAMGRQIYHWMDTSM